jgi:hypothetical protein
MNFGKDENRKYIATMSAVIISPVIYALLIIGIILLIECHPKRHFDKQKWDTNIETRYEMSKNIIKSNMLIGKTKEEVIELLGDEYTDHCSSCDIQLIIYYLGCVPRLFNIDPDHLEIHFKDGKAVKVRQYNS